MMFSRTSNNCLLVLLVSVPIIFSNKVSLAKSLVHNSTVVPSNLSWSQSSDSYPSDASRTDSSGDNSYLHPRRIYNSPSFSIDEQQTPSFQNPVNLPVNPSERFIKPDGLTEYDRDSGLPIPPPPEPLPPPPPPEPL